MLNSDFKKEDHLIENEAKPLLKTYITNLKSSIPQSQFGNARVVRNIWNQLKSILNRRLSGLDLVTISAEQMMTVTASDIKNLG